MDATTPEAHPEPAVSQSERPKPPAQLSLGVIIWSDDPEEDPTVIADRNPVTLARVMATTIHDMMDDSPAFVGATGFLESHAAPADWQWPEDVDDWLEELREATPYPAFSFHQIPTNGGADGTNRSVVNRHLEQALRERELHLTGIETQTDTVPVTPGRNDIPREI